MMLSNKRSLAALVAGVGVLAAAGCGSSNDEATGATAQAACKPKIQIPTISKGVLTVVGPQYPPLFTYTNGKVGGVDGDELTQIAKDACLSLKVSIQPAAGVIASVQAKRADVAAGGWYISPDRAKIVGQTDPNYSDPPMLVSKSGSNKLADFKGKKVGTTQGYVWEDDFKKWAGDKGKLYQSPDAVYADLVAGRIDAALMAVNEGGYRLKKSPSGLKGGVMQSDPAIAASVRPSVTNFPHVKGKPGLTQALNSEIRRMQDGGQLSQILQSYGLDPSAAKPAG